MRGPFPSDTKRRLRISRYVDDRKIAGDALGWSSLLMQSTRCTGRSIDHSTLLPRARGFTAFFQARNFSSSEDRLRMCFDSSRKRGRKFSSLFFCSFIAVDWSIQIASFHNREFYPSRKMSFDGALVTENRPQIFPDLSIVCRHRCCG